MDVKNDFDFYLKFTKPLVLNLSDVSDRVLAAAWVKRLIEDEAASEQTKLSYLMLLLFLLQRRTINHFVFKQHPNTLENLEELPENKPLVDVAKEILETERKEHNEKVRMRLKGGDCGDFPPFESDYSSDLLEYVAYQNVEDFGVHAYYAISKQPLNVWDRVEKMFLPKAVKSLVEVSVVRTPQGAAANFDTSGMSQASAAGAAAAAASPPDAGPLEAASSSSPELGSVDKGSAGSKGKKKKKGSGELPCSAKRKSTLGAKPPVSPLGKVDKTPEDRSRPTWGSNLLKLQETTSAFGDSGFVDLDSKYLGEESATAAGTPSRRRQPLEEMWTSAGSAPYMTPPIPHVTPRPEDYQDSGGDATTTESAPSVSFMTPGPLPPAAPRRSQSPKKTPSPRTKLFSESIASNQPPEYDLEDLDLGGGAPAIQPPAPPAVTASDTNLTSEEAQQILKDAQEASKATKAPSGRPLSKAALKRQQDMEAHKKRFEKVQAKKASEAAALKEKQEKEEELMRKHKAKKFKARPAPKPKAPPVAGAKEKQAEEPPTATTSATSTTAAPDASGAAPAAAAKKPKTIPRYRIPTAASKGRMVPKKAEPPAPPAKPVPKKKLTAKQKEKAELERERAELDEFSRAEKEIEDAMKEAGEDPHSRPTVLTTSAMPGKASELSRMFNNLARLAVTPRDVEEVAQGQYSDLLPGSPGEEEFERLERSIESDMRAWDEDPHERKANYLIAAQPTPAQKAAERQSQLASRDQYGELAQALPLQRDQQAAEEYAQMARDLQERQLWEGRQRLADAYKRLGDRAGTPALRSPPIFSRYPSVREAAALIPTEQPSVKTDEDSDGDIEWYPAEEYLATAKTPSPAKPQREQRPFEAVFPGIQLPQEAQAADIGVIEAPEELEEVIPPSPDKTLERLKAIADRHKKQHEDISAIPCTVPRPTPSPRRPADTSFLLDDSSPELYVTPQSTPPPPPTPESPPIDQEALKRAMAEQAGRFRKRRQPKKPSKAPGVSPVKEVSETRPDKMSEFKKRVQERGTSEMERGRARKFPAPALRTIHEPIVYPDSPKSTRPEEELPMELRKPGRRRDVRRKLSRKKIDFYQPSSPTGDEKPFDEAAALAEIQAQMKAEMPAALRSPPRSPSKLLKSPEADQPGRPMQLHEKQPLLALSPPDFSELEAVSPDEEVFYTPEWSVRRSPSPQAAPGSPRTPRRYAIFAEEQPEFGESPPAIKTPETPDSDRSPMSRRGVMEGVLEEVKKAPGYVVRQPMKLRGYPGGGHLPRRYRYAQAWEEDTLETIEEDRIPTPPRLGTPPVTTQQDFEGWYDREMAKEEPDLGVSPIAARPMQEIEYRPPSPQVKPRLESFQLQQTTPKRERPVHTEDEPFLVPAETPPLFEEGLAYTPDGTGILEEEADITGSPLSPKRPEDVPKIVEAQYRQLRSPGGRTPPAPTPYPQQSIQYSRGRASTMDQDMEFEELEQLAERGEDVEQYVKTKHPVGKAEAQYKQLFSPGRTPPRAPRPAPKMRAIKLVWDDDDDNMEFETLEKTLEEGGDIEELMKSMRQTNEQMTAASEAAATEEEGGEEEEEEEQAAPIEFDKATLAELGLTEADLAEISLGDLEDEQISEPSGGEDLEEEIDPELAEMDRRLADYEKLLDELEQDNMDLLEEYGTPPESPSDVQAALSPERLRSPPRRALSPQEQQQMSRVSPARRSPQKAVSPHVSPAAQGVVAAVAQDSPDSPGMEQMMARLRKHMKPMFPPGTFPAESIPYKYQFSSNKQGPMENIEETLEVSTPPPPPTLKQRIEQEVPPIAVSPVKGKPMQEIQYQPPSPRIKPRLAPLTTPKATTSTPMKPLRLEDEPFLVNAGMSPIFDDALDYSPDDEAGILQEEPEITGSPLSPRRPEDAPIIADAQYRQLRSPGARTPPSPVATPRPQQSLKYVREEDDDREFEELEELIDKGAGMDELEESMRRPRPPRKSPVKTLTVSPAQAETTTETETEDGEPPGQPIRDMASYQTMMRDLEKSMREEEPPDAADRPQDGESPPSPHMQQLMARLRGQMESMLPQEGRKKKKKKVPFRYKFSFNKLDTGLDEIQETMETTPPRPLTHIEQAQQWVDDELQKERPDLGVSPVKWQPLQEVEFRPPSPVKPPPAFVPPRRVSPPPQHSRPLRVEDEPYLVPATGSPQASPPATFEERFGDVSESGLDDTMEEEGPPEEFAPPVSPTRRPEDAMILAKAQYRQLHSGASPSTSPITRQTVKYHKEEGDDDREFEELEQRIERGDDVQELLRSMTRTPGSASPRPAAQVSPRRAPPSPQRVSPTAPSPRAVTPSSRQVSPRQATPPSPRQPSPRQPSPRQPSPRQPSPRQPSPEVCPSAPCRTLTVSAAPKAASPKGARAPSPVEYDTNALAELGLTEADLADISLGDLDDEQISEPEDLEGEEEEDAEAAEMDRRLAEYEKLLAELEGDNMDITEDEYGTPPDSPVSPQSRSPSPQQQAQISPPRRSPVAASPRTPTQQHAVSRMRTPSPQQQQAVSAASPDMSPTMANLRALLQSTQTEEEYYDGDRPVVRRKWQKLKTRGPAVAAPQLSPVEEQYEYSTPDTKDYRGPLQEELPPYEYFRTPPETPQRRPPPPRPLSRSPLPLEVPTMESLAEQQRRESPELKMPSPPPTVRVLTVSARSEDSPLSGAEEFYSPISARAIPAGQVARSPSPRAAAPSPSPQRVATPQRPSQATRRRISFDASSPGDTSGVSPSAFATPAAPSPRRASPRTPEVSPSGISSPQMLSPVRLPPTPPRHQPAKICPALTPRHPLYVPPPRVSPVQQVPSPRTPTRSPCPGPRIEETASVTVVTEPFEGRTSPGMLDTSPIDAGDIPEHLRGFKWIDDKRRRRK